MSGECPYCDDPVTLRYEDLGLTLECESGEHPLSLAVSPRLLDAHPDGDVVERVAVVVGQRIERDGETLSLALDREASDVSIDGPNA